MAKAPSKKTLSGKELEKKLTSLSGWQLNKKQTELSKVFEIRSFVFGLAFIAKVTVHAEVMQHHPTIELTHEKVKIKLTTHEVKALTKEDFELAKKIDGIKC